MISHIFNSYARLLIKGVQNEVARQNAANPESCRLVVFKGNIIGAPFNSMGLENVVYESISPGAVDALIVPANVYTTHFSAERLAEEVRSYGVPATVCTGLALPGFTSVVMDPGDRLQQLVSHLIEHHGRRKLAFFCGAPTNADAQLRLAAFQQALADHHLEVLPEHLLPGDFSFYLARTVLEERYGKARPTFDALVCANDEVAVEAIRFFQEKGLRIPEDIAVTGIDDIDQASLLLPQLTTIHEPVAEMAARAVQLALDNFRHPGRPPAVEKIATRLALRSSCGCLAKLEGHKQLPIPATFRVRAGILETGAEQDDFLLEFQRFVEARIRAGDDAGLLQNYVFRFRTRILRELADKITPRNITDLLAEMQKIVAQLSQLVYAHFQEGFEDLARGMRAFVRMEQVVEWKGIAAMLDEWLPTLDVALFLLVKYPEPVACSHESTWVFPPHARVHHAWIRGTEPPLTEAERTFDPGVALLPPAVLALVDHEQWIASVVQFRDQQFGYFVYDTKNLSTLSSELFRINLKTLLQNHFLYATG